MTPDLKTCLKKAEAAAKKQVAKEKKIREKAQEKAQINDIRRMALSNKRTQIGNFKDILFDPTAPPGSDPPEASSPPPVIHQTPATETFINNMQAIGKKQKAQQQTVSQKRLSNLRNAKRPWSVTLPPVQMELIRLGTRRVKIPINAVESTLSRRMQAVSDAGESE